LTAVPGVIAGNLAVAVECAAALGPGALLLPRAPEGPIPDPRAVVVAEGVAPSLAALDALLAAGARRVVQAVEADPDAARAAPIADALLRRLGAGLAPVAPGDPARGRSVYLGHLFLGTAPAAEPNLVRRLGAAAEAPVALVPYRVVEGGAAAIRGALSAAAESGRRLAVVDALDDRHLRALAEAATLYPLLIGTAGLVAALVAALAGDAPGTDAPPPPGPAAILAASEARATVAQLGLARLHLPSIEAGDVDATLGRAAPLLGADGPLIVAVPASSDRPRIAAALAAGLVARGVTRLLVAGDEACDAVLRRLDPRALRVAALVDPGVPWLTDEATGLHLLLKPGESGARDVLLRAFGHP